MPSSGSGRRGHERESIFHTEVVDIWTRPCPNDRAAHQEVATVGDGALWEQVAEVIDCHGRGVVGYELSLELSLELYLCS